MSHGRSTTEIGRIIGVTKVFYRCYNA